MNLREALTTAIAEYVEAFHHGTFDEEEKTQNRVLELLALVPEIDVADIIDVETEAADVD